MRRYLFTFLLLICFAIPIDEGSTNSTKDERKLMYLQIVSTNGHYHPLVLYPKDENTPEDFPEGLGALTKLGKLQQYELGKFLRERYKSFITSNPDEIDAFSSIEDRSTLSLLTLLASLNAPTKEWEIIPGFPWQPPALSFMNKADYFFSYNDSCENQFLDAQLRFLQYHGDRDKFLYSFWKENSGMDIFSWNEIALLHDAIMKEMDGGLPVPWWAEKFLPDMERIANAAYTQNYNSILSMKVKIGILLDFVTVRMQVKMLKDDPSPAIKVSVYMTHDRNMAALLTALGHFSGVRPPPCTTANFELYQENGDYSVRVLLFNSTSPELGKQTAHVLTLKGCTEYCPLSRFADHFHRLGLFPVLYNYFCGRALLWKSSAESWIEYEMSEERWKTELALYDEMKAMTDDTV